MDLNEDDVIQIIRYLDESNFNELRLQIGDLRIVVNRSGSPTSLPEVDQALASADPPAAYSRRPRLRHPYRNHLRRLSQATRKRKPPQRSQQYRGDGSPSRRPCWGLFTGPRTGGTSLRGGGYRGGRGHHGLHHRGHEAVQHHQGGETRAGVRVSVEDGELVECEQVLLVLDPDVE